MPYVGSSVDESTKEKWEKYLEESSYGSMSELVRGAVRKEIQSDGTSAGTSDEQTIEVDRLNEQQQKIMQKVEGLHEVVEEVQEEQKKTEYPEEIVSVAHEIAGDLETISDDDFERLVTERMHQLSDLSTKYLDDNANTELDKIVAALNYLEENVQWIRRHPATPSDYYRVED